MKVGVGVYELECVKTVFHYQYVGLAGNVYLDTFFLFYFLFQILQTTHPSVFAGFGKLL